MNRFCVVAVVMAAACVAAPPPKTPQPSLTQQTNDRYAREIAARIAGQETAPAEQVFKNIQILKGVPASRVLLIMNRGYSRALGVTCTHCHVESDFASDEKRPKRAAREMALIHRMIIARLKEMQNLEHPPDQRFINCSTCHRGSTDPVAADRAP